MKRSLLVLLLALLLPLALASGPIARAQSAPGYYQITDQYEDELLYPEELDDLLAPIALYPDPLIAQILPAATFVDQIHEAARFVRRYGNTSRIDYQPWDLSVRAIAHYPRVLYMMDKEHEWTASIGQAYVEQPQDVMDAIQRLRDYAREQGNLYSTREQEVIYEGDVIRIIPARPQYLYVPVYDPYVVYVEPYRPAYPLITFSVGFTIGAWLNRDCDWRQRRVYYHGWRGDSWVRRARPYVRDRRGVYINQRASTIVVNQTIVQRDTRVYRDRLRVESRRHREEGRLPARTRVEQPRPGRVERQRPVRIEQPRPGRVEQQRPGRIEQPRPGVTVQPGAPRTEQRREQGTTRQVAPTPGVQAPATPTKPGAPATIAPRSPRPATQPRIPAGVPRSEAVKPSQQPAVQQPAVQQPAVQQPAVQQPAVQQPAVRQPTVRQPAVRQPAVRQPAVRQPAVQQPAVQQPTVQPPAAGEQRRSREGQGEPRRRVLRQINRPAAHPPAAAPPAPGTVPAPSAGTPAKAPATPRAATPSPAARPVVEPAPAPSVAPVPGAAEPAAPSRPGREYEPGQGRGGHSESPSGGRAPRREDRQ